MLKSKKLCTAVLAVFFLSVFTGLGTPKASAATYPTDIAGHWAATQLLSLYNQGVISGYGDGTIKPNNAITRAEFMSMINRAFNFVTPTSIYFSDVKTTDWFYLDVCKARAAGYIAGYDDGTMRPNNNISREEAAVMLAKAMGLNTGSYGYLPFTDVGKFSPWSTNSVAALYAGGYISGNGDGTYKPTSAITRGEAAAMIYAGNSLVRVTSVSLNKTTLKLGLGKSETLVATVSPSNATNQAITWVSSTPSVAIVSSTGVVTGVTEGTAIVTVTAGGQTAICTVTVSKSVAVTGVSLNKSTLYLDDGDDYDLVATVSPSNATNKDLIWSTSDDDVAEVDDDGNVTAVDDGTCTIKVKTEDGGYYDTCKVYVNYDNDGDLTVSPSSIDMDTDDEATVKVYLPDDYTAEDIDDIDWDLDDDDDVIYDVDYEDYEDDDDYIKFVITSDEDNEGDATITFMLEIDGDEYEGDCDVTVGEGSDDGDFYVYGGDFDMDVDDTTTIKVFLPVDIDEIDYYDYYSDDEDIADIVDYDEYDSYIKFTVESYDEGETTLYFYCETEDGDDYDCSCDVTVGDGGGSGGDDEITLSDYDIDIDAGDSDEVIAYLPDDYTCGDMESIGAPYVDDEDEVLYAIGYDHDYDDDDDYLTFIIRTNEDADGTATIRFKIKFDGDWYYSDYLDVNVS